ncbi:hypothetical protein HKD37_07G018281 [Glycine soja]
MVLRNRSEWIPLFQRMSSADEGRQCRGLSGGEGLCCGGGIVETGDMTTATWYGCLRWRGDGSQ